MNTKSIPQIPPLSRALLLGLMGAMVTTRLCFAATNVWTGANAALLWQTPANWDPAGPPGVTDSAMFWDAGATNLAGSYVANNVVSSSRTIASLMFGQTNGIHNTLLNPGVTLTISNDAPEALVFTGTGTDNGNATVVTATISGTGAALEVLSTNSGSQFNVRQGSTTSGATKRATMNLSELDTFSLAVGRLLVAGDGTSAAVRNRPSGTLILARTNTIRLNGSAPAFNVGDGSSNGGTEFVELGQTNALFADSMTIARQKCTATLNFSSYLIGFDPVFYLRGNTADRMSAMAIGDLSAQTGSSTHNNGTVDLTSGRVDALVDTCYIARGINGSGNGRATGLLQFGAGVFDVNTLEVAYVNTNVALSTVTGTVEVNSPGTLVVNDYMRLGRNPGAAATAAATLTVNGGQVRANSITTSPTNVDTIINFNGAVLILTNTAGSPAEPITTFNVADSTLQLRIELDQTNIVVTTLSASMSFTNNTIDILSLPIITGYPVQYPLISYGIYYQGVTEFQIGRLPAASPTYTGYISNNTTTGTIDLVLTGGPPPAQTLTWKGNLNGDWDLITANWAATGGPAVFRDKDLVMFDNTATGSTTVDLKVEVLPSSLLVSNASKPYQFVGGGSIAGPVSLVKDGAGQLTLANTGNNFFEGGVDILQGTVQLGGPADRLPTNSPVNIADAAGASLDLNGVNQTIQLLAGGGAIGGSVSLGSGILTVVGGGGSFTGVVSGAGSVVKTGIGTQTLGGANLYSGGTVISDGRLNVANTTGSGTGPGFVLVETNGTLGIGIGDASGSVGVATITNHGTVVFNRSDEFTMANTITGDGALTKTALGTMLVPISNTYTGLTTINNGALRVSNPGALGDETGETYIQGGENSAAARLELIGNITLTEPIRFGQKQSAAGQSPGIVNVSGTNTLAGSMDATGGGSYWIMQVDEGKLNVTGNITNTTASNIRRFRLLGVATGEIQGPIYRIEGSTSPTGILKEQSGTWIISGSSFLPGPISVSEGTLLLNGNIYGGGTVTVNAGILGGTGQLDGPVTVTSVGTLAPGTSIGALTVNNTLDLQGIALMDVSSTGNDQVKGVSTLTLGGTLQVVVNGPLNGGEVFKLFDAGTINGDFGFYDLPVLPAPLGWDFSQVPVNGTLRVTGGTPRPGIAPVYVSGGNLVVGIPTVAGYSYVLQSSTNIGSAASWVNESTNSGTGSDLILNVPIEPAKPQKFLRFWVY